MDFNLDDPLAGILSDGSDDSFFDDDILGKKKPAKKKDTPIAEKKNALFNLGDDDVVKPNVAPLSNVAPASLERQDLYKFSEMKVPSDDVEKGSVSDSKPSSFKRAVSKDSIHFQAMDRTSDIGHVNENANLSTKSPAKSKLGISLGHDLDRLGDPIIEKKKVAHKPIEKGKSSQSLLDDILGGSSTKAGGSSLATRPTTAAKSQDFDLDSFLGKSESKQTMPSNKPKQNKEPEAALKKEPKKKSTDDWLGIFEDKAEEKVEVSNEMPSWLSGPKKKLKPEAEKPQKPSTPVETPEEVKTGLSIPFPSTLEGQTISNMQHGSNEDITAEGAAMYMQQQESQLMVALQMKAQEEKLAAMQARREESSRLKQSAAQAQRSHTEAMLRRAADSRQQVQAAIADHQNRIASRIRALLGPSTKTDDETEDATENVADDGVTEARETPHSREKKQLLQLVQSLQENHDKEIDIMETSYRRQLAFLEVSLNQYEDRMKEESDKIVKFYTEKISWLEEHHHLYRKLAEDNLKATTERHREENKVLRQQQSENTRILHEHHTALMENIKQAVKQEQVVIQDSSGFSSSLLDLVADVKESKEQFQQLVDKVKSIAESCQRDTERSLHSRETHIDDMIQQLKNEREHFESEKNENREMAKLLENRLKQMTSLIEEETASLKQKRMEFEFEKATFHKQTEFAKNILKNQDEEIKMIKDDIQKEYREKIARINEEKAKAQKDSVSAAKEKSNIVNLRQELERMKAELHAQLEEMSETRSKLNIEKQQVNMEEQRVVAKSRDLDLLAKAAVEKQSQADKKYSEAEFMQRKYEERIRRIQEHVVSLNSREKQIAREKVALSRERLSIHNEKKQIESRQQCSLCKSSHYANQYSNYEPTYNLPESFQNIPVSRDYGGENINAIETEMAHVLGRNYGVKSNIVDNNVEGVNVDRRIFEHLDSIRNETTSPFKDYMDPKFMMLRLDVQQVISNLEQNKKEVDLEEQIEDHSYEEENKEE